MKKIVAYIGSRKGKDSTTYCFTKKILDRVLENSINIDYEILLASDYNIKNCKSCANCFFNGSCILDDDMNIIKNKLLEAEFIIFGSPVYAHNISGDMKILIDRLSYWLHLLTLRNKSGLVISTNSSNGSNFVLGYLKKIMTFLGIDVVGELNGALNYPDQINNPIWLQENIENYSNLIIDTINLPMKTNTDLDNYFNTMKTIMKFQEESNINSKELDYWKQNNMLNCESYSDVLLSMQKEISCGDFL